MVVTTPVACGGDGAPPTWRDAHRRVLAVLNGLAAACLVMAAVLSYTAAPSFEPDIPDDAGIIGGSEGPTVVWYTDHIPPDMWRALIVVMLAIFLAVNAVVLWRPPKAHP